ncbi:MAG TPA: hypothetical protein VKC90_03905 [Chitinophagaceae bacterium]|nr:hypothetical protein [Chitinophagaceae bacterium]
MSNNHQEKYITKLLFGFTFITAGILLILYAAFERTRQEDWYFWGIVASVLVNAGLYFLLTAFVHKVKSDLIKRQKMREQQKTFTADE